MNNNDNETQFINPICTLLLALYQFNASVGTDHFYYGLLYNDPVLPS